MNGWQIGLEYLQTLVWPMVVLFVALRFKTEFKGLLNRLKSIKTPAGSAEFEREARETAAQAEAVDRQVAAGLEEAAKSEPALTGSLDGHGPSTRDGQDANESKTGTTPDPLPPEGMDESGDENEAEADTPLLSPALRRAWTADEFQVFRDVATKDPSAAVMGAWRKLEKFMHLTLRERGLTEPWTGARLTRQLNELYLGPHFIDVAENLRRLRNQVTHDPSTNVSTKGALDYIDAAERLADALVIAQPRIG